MKNKALIASSLLAACLFMSNATGLLAAPANAVDSGTKHTPFYTVLMRDWDKWDTDKNGVLSIPEIDRAVLDLKVKGDDAAVAGSLKLMSRSKKIVVPIFSREYFAQYDHDAMNDPASFKTKPEDAINLTTDTGTSGAAPATPALSKKPINWELYYTAGKGRIAKGGGAWPTAFNLDHAHQGQLGDCYLIATLGSMVVHHPSEVTQLVKPLSDGSYKINMPGVAPFNIPPLTDSQLVISSTTTGQGEWLAVIEQAIGKYNEKVGGSSDNEGTDTIANGGHLDAALAMLTGHQFLKIRMHTTIAHRQDDAEKTLADLRKALLSAMHDGRVITASVTPPMPSAGTPANGSKAAVPALTADMLPKIPPNINTKHAYAVLGYAADTDMLEIWNPHGQNFTPKGPDGLVNGYKTDHGKFHIPLKEAYTFYTSFVFELDADAAQTTARAGSANHAS